MLALKPVGDCVAQLDSGEITSVSTVSTGSTVSLVETSDTKVLSDFIIHYLGSSTRRVVPCDPRTSRTVFRLYPSLGYTATEFGVG